MITGSIFAELGRVDSGKPSLFRLPDSGIQDFKRRSLETSAAQSLIGHPPELLQARLCGCTVHFPGDLFCLRRHLPDHRAQNTPTARTGSVGGSLSQFAQNHIEISAHSERMAERFQSFPEPRGGLAGLRKSCQVDQRLQAARRNPQIVNCARTAGPQNSPVLFAKPAPNFTYLSSKRTPQLLVADVHRAQRKFGPCPVHARHQLSRLSSRAPSPLSVVCLTSSKAFSGLPTPRILK